MPKYPKPMRFEEGRRLDRSHWGDARHPESAGDMRSLAKTQELCRVDFSRLLRQLHARFRGEPLRVLVEGAGFSTVPEELELWAKENQIPLAAVRSDVYKARDFKTIAAGINASGVLKGRGVAVGTSRYVKAESHELVSQFGKNRFHLVISVYGGLMYAQTNQKAAWENVADVVKPGGEVVALSHDNPMMKGTANSIYWSKAGQAVAKKGLYVREDSHCFFPNHGDDLFGASPVHESEESDLRWIVWTRGRKRLPFEGSEPAWDWPNPFFQQQVD